MDKQEYWDHFSEKMKRLLGWTPDYPGVIKPINLAGPIIQYQYDVPAEAPNIAPFECEICHKTIENQNEVVCLWDQENSLSFGVPVNHWSKLICSSQCAHALLDTHLVTWRLKGLFGDPKEEEGYY